MSIKLRGPEEGLTIQLTNLANQQEEPVTPQRVGRTEGMANLPEALRPPPCPPLATLWPCSSWGSWLQDPTEAAPERSSACNSPAKGVHTQWRNGLHKFAFGEGLRGEVEEHCVPSRVSGSAAAPTCCQKLEDPLQNVARSSTPFFGRRLASAGAALGLLADLVEHPRKRSRFSGKHGSDPTYNKRGIPLSSA